MTTTERRAVRFGALRRATSSVRVRIVVGYVVLLIAALAIAVVVTRQVQFARAAREIDQELRQEVQELRVLAREGSDPETGEPLGDDVERIFEIFLDRNLPLDDEAFYTLVDGEPFGASPLAPDLFAVAPLVETWANVTETTETNIDTEFGEVLALAVPLRAAGGVEGVFVVVSFPDDDQAEVNQVVRVITFAGLIVLIVTSALAWSLAARVLRPVRDLTATARGITDSDLSARIPVEGSRRARRARCHVQRDGRPARARLPLAAPVPRRHRPRAADTDHDRPWSSGHARRRP